MVREYTPGPMEKFMMENGPMDSSMEVESGEV